MRLIIVFFCAHSLIPLEAELLELVEVYQTLMSWVSSTALPGFFLCSATAGLALSLNMAISWCRPALLNFLAGTICLLLAVGVFFVGWDLAFSSMSAVFQIGEPHSFYLQPKTTLTYDNFYAVEDQFDWHRDRQHPFVMRFEDLYMFFLQLLNLLTLSFALVVWLTLLIDAITLGSAGVSYTYIGVGIR